MNENQDQNTGNFDSSISSSLIENTGKFSSTDIPLELFETDVLVIGGGIAGTFAAIKAKEAGADVILADKGTVGCAGKSPWFGAYTVYEKWGLVSRNMWSKTLREACDYISNWDYIEMYLDDSKSIYKDLASWGAVNPKGGKGHGPLLRKRME